MRSFINLYFQYQSMMAKTISLICLACLFMAMSCGVRNSRIEAVNKFGISFKCIGQLCLGDSIRELKNQKGIEIRRSEFQYSNSNYIDSVAFVENIIRDDTISYSRIPIGQYNDSKIVEFIVTESSQVSAENGLKVGLPFSELKKLIPEVKFERLPHESLGSDQFRRSIMVNDTDRILFVINYGELEINGQLDTIVQSISINLIK